MSHSDQFYRGPDKDTYAWTLPGKNTSLITSCTAKSIRALYVKIFLKIRVLSYKKLSEVGFSAFWCLGLIVIYSITSCSGCFKLTAKIIKRWITHLVGQWTIKIEKQQKKWNSFLNYKVELSHLWFNASTQPVAKKMDAACLLQGSQVPGTDPFHFLSWATWMKSTLFHPTLFKMNF